MITHGPKRKSLDRPGEILTVRVRIVESCTAEIVPVDGKHMGELVAGETYDLPVWSAKDLIARGKATGV